MRLLARTCKSEQMNFERLFARVFVVLGGAFWLAAALGANTYRPAQADPWIVLGLTVVVLAVGWFYEYLAAAVLAVGAVGVIVWGVVADWAQSGGGLLWVTMTGLLIAPMVIAAVLFLLAARMQRICALEERPRGSSPSPA